MAPAKIRVIAIGLFRHGDRLLVFEGYDDVEGSWFYRPLGGAVEPGERAEDALAREIREELGCEITDIRQLAVLENLFEYLGNPCHEIVFVFAARFVDPSVYGLEAPLAREDDGAAMTVCWREIDGFDEQHRLVPTGLRELLTSHGHG